MPRVRGRRSYILSQHATQRILERGISPDDVEATLEKAPPCLIAGNKGFRHTWGRITVILDRNREVIITAYLA